MPLTSRPRKYVVRGLTTGHWPWSPILSRVATVGGGLGAVHFFCVGCRLRLVSDNTRLVEVTNRQRWIERDPMLSDKLIDDRHSERLRTSTLNPTSTMESFLTSPQC